MRRRLPKRIAELARTKRGVALSSLHHVIHNARSAKNTGNIRGYTRTMTTTIALETSRGDLSLALALGIILVGLSMVVSAAGLFFGGSLRDR
jgi:ABC-type tungstate transport system substrate-binding protein